MTFDEHIAWARARAFEYLELGRPRDAIASFVSDMAKHRQAGGIARIGEGLGVHGVPALVMLYQSDAAAVRFRLEQFALEPLPETGG